MFKQIGLIVIAAFAAILLVGLSAERALAAGPAAERPGVALVSLGHTAANSHTSVGEVAWQLPGQRWEVGAMLIGQGATRRGAIADPIPVYSFSRLVRPGWRLFGADAYLRLGAAYVDGHPLVGEVNYRLGAGLRWPVAALELGHFSSGGIYDPNTGVDGLLLRVPLAF